MSGIFVTIQYKAVCPLLLHKISVLVESLNEMQHPNSISSLTILFRSFFRNKKKMT
jgi:hypothetical protein